MPPPEAPESLGSGKFDTPWLRMHRANFRPCSRCCAACAGLAWVCGMYCSHFCRATLKAWALIATPLTEIVCPLAAILMPFLLRSGKLGTPLARMHLEKASVALAETDLRGEEFDRVVRPDLAGELAPVESFEAVGDPVPVDALEPQAAMISAAASAATNPESRLGRNAGDGLPCTWSRSLSRGMTSRDRA